MASERYAFLIAAASAPTGGSGPVRPKTFLPSTLLSAMYATSKAETPQKIHTTKFAPVNCDRSLRSAVGRSRAPRARPRPCPTPRTRPRGPRAGAAAGLFFSPPPYARSSTQLPTRQSVMGARKNWIRERRKMGKRFRARPWVRVDHRARSGASAGGVSPPTRDRLDGKRRGLESRKN